MPRLFGRESAMLTESVVVAIGEFAWAAMISVYLCSSGEPPPNALTHRISKRMTNRC